MSSRIESPRSERRFATLNDIPGRKRSLRKKKVILDAVNRLCRFFDCELSDLFEYVPDDA